MDIINHYRKYRTAFLFSVAILLAVAVYSGGWFYMAEQIKRHTKDKTESLAAQGKIITCDGHEVRGFPFRLGIFCDRIAYSDHNRSIMIETGALRSAGQIYNPGKLVAEMDGPVAMRFSDITSMINWSQFRLSSQINLTQPPSSLSVELEDISVHFSKNVLKLPNLSASRFVGHIRKKPQTQSDLDVAISLFDPKFTKAGLKALQLRRFEFDAVITKGYEHVLDWQDVHDRIASNGLDAGLRHLTITTSTGASASFSGPVKISPNGLIDAQLELEISQIGKLAKSLQMLARDYGFEHDLFDQVSVFSALQTNSKTDQTETLSVTISQGNVRIGFFHLGRIPSLLGGDFFY